jgi:4,5-dihydroxyphthalate decarboxylase
MADSRNGTTIVLVGNGYPFFKYVTSQRDGFDLQFKPVGPGESFKAVLEDLPFQANEFSLASYSMMRDQGINRMIAIPVFLNRAFRHGSLYVRKDSDLTHPSQLRGKSVGAKEYSQTAAVWWRGTMIDEYDLHWSDLKWVVGPKPRFSPPSEAGVEAVAGDIGQMVLDGEIDAYPAPSLRGIKNPEDREKLRPLILDNEAAERDYYARTGIYRLNHAVVIHADCLAQHPGLARPLFDAYSASKKQFYAEGGNTNPWGDTQDDDPIPFGLTAKNSEVVEMLFRYLHEQKFISKVPNIDDMFVDDAATFVD